MTEEVRKLVLGTANGRGADDRGDDGTMEPVDHLALHRWPRLMDHVEMSVFSQAEWHLVDQPMWLWPEVSAEIHIQTVREGAGQWNK